jgi:hypothetical protein
MPWSSGDVRFWQVKPCGFREADGVHFILRIAKLPRHPFAAAASSSCSPASQPAGPAALQCHAAGRSVVIGKSDDFSPHFIAKLYRCVAGDRLAVAEPDSIE